MHNTNLLQKSVLKTLAYYMALKTPLTLVQIGRYMIDTKCKGQSTKLSEIKNILDEPVKRGIVAEQKGLYWLKLVGTRHWRVQNRAMPCSYVKYVQREKTAQRKIDKVRWALKLFRYIPGLRGLFICGSVARKVSRKSSDIDFLILTEKRRVWTVRFFLTLFSYLLGKKTDNESSRRDKFCLNHYRSSANLKLERELRDLYSAQEYARMINIYSDGEIENQFYAANKKWMERILPNFDFRKPSIHHCRNIARYVPTGLGDLIERFLQKLQTVKIYRSRRNIARYVPTGLDNRRIVSDNEVIMFHLNPRAAGMLENYKKILTTYDKRLTTEIDQISF